MGIEGAKIMSPEEEAERLKFHERLKRIDALIDASLDRQEHGQSWRRLVVLAFTGAAIFAAGAAFMKLLGG
jgi:hypothetical protein